MKIKKLAHCISLSLLAPFATTATYTVAQTTPAEPVKVERVEITGSNIKRVATEGALPVQIITREQLDRQGIVTAEQFLNTLTVNGNGMDNLASNSDVAGGSGRGNNGL